jgi:putative pyruvate formate lyase activating enzyme
VDALRLLDGVIDVYLPDVKDRSDDAALRYSGAVGYTEEAETALGEMHAQVGNLSLEGGIARHAASGSPAACLPCREGET